LQGDALTAAGCWRVFTGHVSGAMAERPELGRVLERLRGGDTLVVWRLDRLGRSLRHLIDVVAGLSARGVGFWPVSESIDAATSGGRLVFQVVGALAERAGPDPGTDPGRIAGRTPARPRRRPPGVDDQRQGRHGAADVWSAGADR
jgi:DNA invertase Pin-like site-specific DNA recombinase